MMGSQDGLNAQYGTVEIDLMFTAAAAGAVPSTLTVSTGIVSVTKSTNDYIVIFDSTYITFLGGGGNVVQASVDATKAFEVKHTAFNAGAAGGASVTISPYNAAGTAQPLVVGDILQYTFRFTRIPQPNS